MHFLIKSIIYDHLKLHLIDECMKFKLFLKGNLSHFHQLSHIFNAKRIDLGSHSHVFTNVISNICKPNSILKIIIKR